MIKELSERAPACPSCWPSRGTILGHALGIISDHIASSYPEILHLQRSELCWSMWHGLVLEPPILPVETTEQKIYRLHHRSMYFGGTILSVSFRNRWNPDGFYSEWWLDTESLCFREEEEPWPPEKFNSRIMVRVDQVQDFWALPSSHQRDLLYLHGITPNQLQTVVRKINNQDMVFISEIFRSQSHIFERRANAWYFAGFRITNCESRIVKKFVVYA